MLADSARMPFAPRMASGGLGSNLGARSRSHERPEIGALEALGLVTASAYCCP
jgi:hypothetical protein